MTYCLGHKSLGISHLEKCKCLEVPGHWHVRKFSVLGSARGLCVKGSPGIPRPRQLCGITDVSHINALSAKPDSDSGVLVLNKILAGRSWQQVTHLRGSIRSLGCQSPGAESVTERLRSPAPPLFSSWMGGLRSLWSLQRPGSVPGA